MPGRITVVGARGFVGSAVAAHARAAGFDVLATRHDDLPDGDPLGIVVYCSGVASGAESQPLEAWRQHVGALLHLVREHRYDRLVYVSSTRVYDGAGGTSETCATSVHVDDVASTYVASKLAGEAVALAASQQNSVVRLSNVYGASLRSELFLSDIVRQAVRTGRISLRSALDSSKDYVSVDDVAASILRIAEASNERVYNVAAGRNVKHRDLIAAIAAATAAEVDVAPDAPRSILPAIDTTRLQSEYPFDPRDVVADLPAIVAAFRAGTP